MRMATQKIDLQLNNTQKFNLRLSSNQPVNIGMTSGNAMPGTRNYELLTNRPRINGVELVGDLSHVDLGIVSENTTEGWALTPMYIPKKGELVIYTDTEKIKVGDGQAYLVDLPFIGGDAIEKVEQELHDHMDDDVSHVTQTDRDFWDSKLNYSLMGENLKLTRS